MTFERFDIRALHLAARRPAPRRERLPPGAGLRREARRLAAAHGPARLRQDAPRRRDRQLPPRARRGRRLRGAEPARLPAPPLRQRRRRRLVRGLRRDEERAAAHPRRPRHADRRSPGCATASSSSSTTATPPRLPTVITTALSLDDLGERLASRLVDHAVCSVIVLGEPRRDAAPPAPRPQEGLSYVARLHFRSKRRARDEASTGAGRRRERRRGVGDRAPRRPARGRLRRARRRSRHRHLGRLGRRIMGRAQSRSARAHERPRPRREFLLRPSRHSSRP